MWSKSLEVGPLREVLLQSGSVDQDFSLDPGGDAGCSPRRAGGTVAEFRADFC